MRYRAGWLVLLVAASACDAFREPPNSFMPVVFGTGGGSGLNCGTYPGPDLSVLRPAYRDLYAWLSEEEAAALIEKGQPFFERSERASSLLDVIQTDPFHQDLMFASWGEGYTALEFLAASDPLELAALGDGVSVLMTWPLPVFAWRVDEPRSRLLRVTLRPEAWIMVQGDSTVYDANNRPVEESLVRAQPFRVAGIVGSHQDDAPGARTFCSADPSANAFLGSRWYILSNPMMIQSFSVDGPEAFTNLRTGVDHLVTYLEQIRSGSEPPLTRVELPCVWALYDAVPIPTTDVPSCAVGYLASMNVDDARYLPTVANLVDIIDSVRTIRAGAAYEAEMPDPTASPSMAGSSPGGAAGH